MTSPSSTTLPRFAFLTPRALPPASKIEGRVAVLDVGVRQRRGRGELRADDAPLHQGARRAAGGLGRPPRPRAARRLRGRSALRADDQGGARRLPRVGDARSGARGGSGRQRWRCTSISTGSTRAPSGSWGASSPTRAPMPTRARSTPRRGEPGPIADRIDRALRARFRDETLKHRVIQYLVARAKSPVLWGEIRGGRARDRPAARGEQAPRRRLPDDRRGRLRRIGRAPLRQDRAPAHRAGAGTGGGGA